MIACQSLKHRQSLMGDSHEGAISSSKINAVLSRKGFFSSFSNGQRRCRFPLSVMAFSYLF